MLTRGGAALLAAFLAWASSQASAAPLQDEGRIAVREISVEAFPEVRLEVLIAGRQPDRSTFVVRENDRIVSPLLVVPSDAAADDTSVVLVVDRSGSMDANGALGPARSAARAFVEGARKEDRIALIAFAGTPQVLVPFDAERSSLLQAIDGIPADLSGTALWDSITEAAGLLADAPTDERYIVVVSDIDQGSYDNASTATAAVATQAAVDAGATVFVVELPFGPVDDREIQEVAEQTSGLLLRTTDPEDLGTLLGELQQSLQARYQVTYRSQATTGDVEVLLTAGRSQTESSYSVPSADESEPTSPGSGGLPEGYPILVVAFLAAVAFVAVAIRSRR